MGTFHDDKGPLHGMTVVVETNGDRVYVGRCDEQRPDGIVLLDAGHHDEGEQGRSIADYLSFAVRYGVFKRADRVVVPAGEIARVQRLAEWQADRSGNQPDRSAPKW